MAPSPLGLNRSWELLVEGLRERYANTDDYVQMKLEATVSVGHASVLSQVPTSRLKCKP
jgi:hypothetical protein